jgi:hypothetical protein
MSTAALLAFAVNRLTDIHVTPRRIADDDACIAEIKAVLKRHSLDKKYGLTLLHKHFDLEPGEIMVEHTDVRTRTLTSRPEKAGSIPEENLIEVTWSLDSDTLMAGCMWKCFYTSGATPPHSSHHVGPTNDGTRGPLDLQ